MQILAVDPGRNKSGIAVVDSSKVVHYQGIIVTKEINSLLRGLIKSYDIDIIVIGNGTNVENVRKMIAEEFPLPIKIVDEKNSTSAAEERYRKEKQNWLFRIIKWKPKRPLDDYAAAVLAERYLDKLQID